MKAVKFNVSNICEIPELVELEGNKPPFAFPFATIFYGQRDGLDLADTYDIETLDGLHDFLNDLLVNRERVTAVDFFLPDK